MRRVTTAALAAAAITVAAPAAAAAADPGYVPGTVLVRFKSDLPGARVRSLLAAGGATVERALPLVPGLREVALPPGTSVPDAVAALERQPGVIYAEPDYKRRRFAVPNDPMLGQQWSLHNTGQDAFGSRGTPGADIHAIPAWDTQTGSSTVKVAVVDTGIALSHPDLAPNIDSAHGRNFVEHNNNPNDVNDPDAGHGTAIAGIIGAVGDNGIGIAGINWRTSLMALRAPLDVAGEVAAFNYARNNGAKVINYSAGSGQFSATELAAINASSGVLFSVAAGNDHSNNDAQPIYPCAYPVPNVVCVASTNQHDALSSFSNFGPASVDLAAPGEHILSTYPAGAISNDFSDRFGTAPLTEQWTRGGHGKKWRPTRKFGRGVSISDSPHGRYRNGTNSWIRSRAIDLRGRRACQLQFFAKVRTQRRRDFLILDASRDGFGHWRHLSRISGDSERVRFVFLPTRFDGDSSVYFRFRLRSDASVRRDGVFIDDVNLSCVTTENTYAYVDGTSFSAPMVSGAAALILAQNPLFNVAQLRAKLLASVDPLPSLGGRVATGGRLDLAKAVAP